MQKTKSGRAERLFRDSPSILAMGAAIVITLAVVLLLMTA